MSRNCYIFFLLSVLAWSTPFAAFAQAKPPEGGELAYRVGTGRADDVALLLTSGADPNGKNAQGLPLLLVAAGRKDEGALPVVQLLLEAGADVNGKDTQGQTALYYAARNGKADIVRYLLQKNIDYYSLDYNGDIARTIAFRGGHQAVVDLMDAHVKSQSTLVENTSQNIQKQIKEEQEKQAREARLAEQKAKREAEEQETKQKTEMARKQKEYWENIEKLEDKVYDVSYHACALEYWSFALSANQTLQVSSDELKEIMDTHRQTVRETSMEIMKMFSTNPAYVDKVITPSKQAINTQLGQMPSRTYRKEHGVGTLDDVRERCDRIASNWEIVAAAPIVSAPDQPPASTTPPARKTPAAPAKKTSNNKPFPGQQFNVPVGVEAQNALKPAGPAPGVKKP